MRFYVEYCDLAMFVIDTDEKGPLYSYDVEDAADITDPVTQMMLWETGHNTMEKTLVYTKKN